MNFNGGEQSADSGCGGDSKTSAFGAFFEEFQQAISGGFDDLRNAAVFVTTGSEVGEGQKFTNTQQKENACYANTIAPISTILADNGNSHSNFSRLKADKLFA